MVEVVGDSTRDGRWALVRLAVEGERIVSAEAEGLERPLAGLTLLEAAAVGGDELAVDALANALGQVFRAAADAGPRRRRDERRRRQRGRAAARRARRDRRHAPPLARPAGPGRRARLLLAGGRARRARDLPPARDPARHARPARGVPARGGRAVRARLRGAARRRTRASAATAASASPSCSRSPSAPAPSGSRPATTRASSSAAGGCCSRARPTSARTSRTCSRRLDPRFLDRLWFPLGEQSKDETRAEAARAGLEAASRAESQEACFLAGGDYRDFLERHGLAAAGRRRSSTSRATSSAGTPASGASRPGQREGLGVAAGEPLYALRSEPRTNAVVVGPRAALATDEVPGARPAPRRARPRGGEAALPLARGRRERRRRRRAASGSSLDRPAYGVAPGRPRCSTTDGAVVGAGTIVARILPKPLAAVPAFESEGE